MDEEDEIDGVDQMRWIKQMKWIVYKMDGVSESPVRTPQEDIYPCDALTGLEGGESMMIIITQG